MVIVLSFFSFSFFFFLQILITPLIYLHTLQAEVQYNQNKWGFQLNRIKLMQLFTVKLRSSSSSLAFHRTIFINSRFSTIVIWWPLFRNMFKGYDLHQRGKLFLKIELFYKATTCTLNTGRKRDFNCFCMMTIHLTYILGFSLILAIFSTIYNYAN